MTVKKEHYSILIYSIIDVNQIKLVYTFQFSYFV